MDQLVGKEAGLRAAHAEQTARLAQVEKLQRAAAAKAKTAEQQVMRGATGWVRVGQGGPGHPWLHKHMAPLLWVMDILLPRGWDRNRVVAKARATAVLSCDAAAAHIGISCKPTTKACRSRPC